MKWMLVVWMFARLGSGSAITSETIPYETDEACEYAKTVFLQNYNDWGRAEMHTGLAGGVCLPVEKHQ